MLNTLPLTPRAIELIPPVTEPVTIHEAKSHLDVAADENFHDAKILLNIEAARIQWERDTSSYLIRRTMRLTLPILSEFRFTERPVDSIAAVAYYDAADVQQTLASTEYELDAARGLFRQASGVYWPDVSSRWDAVQVDYVLGEHADSTSVPALAKAAILLL